jgi:hypothetical protein
MARVSLGFMDVQEFSGEELEARSPDDRPGRGSV